MFQVFWTLPVAVVGLLRGPRLSLRHDPPSANEETPFSESILQEHLLWSWKHRERERYTLYFIHQWDGQFAHTPINTHVKLTVEESAQLLVPSAVWYPGTGTDRTVQLSQLSNTHMPRSDSLAMYELCTWQDRYGFYSFLLICFHNLIINITDVKMTKLNFNWPK